MATSAGTWLYHSTDLEDVGRLLQPAFWASSVKWSPDGTHVTTLTRGFLYFWNVRSKVGEQRLDICEQAFAFDYSPDGSQLAVDCREGLKIVSLPSGNTIVRVNRDDLDPRLFYMSSLDWSPDGKHLLLAEGYYRDNGWTWNLRIFNVASQAIEQTLIDSSADLSVVDVEWSPDGRSVMAAFQSSQAVARKWDWRSGQINGQYVTGGRVRDISWSPDGQRLAVGTDSGVSLLSADLDEINQINAGVSVESVSSEARIRQLQGHNERVWRVSWVANGDHVAWVGESSFLNLWSSSTGRQPCASFAWLQRSG